MNVLVKRPLPAPAIVDRLTISLFSGKNHKVGKDKLAKHEKI
ncbi:MAG: hypothetical protein WDO16_03210 [Bacteroidota bacterium]